MIEKRTNNNYLFGGKDPQLTRLLYQRAQLHNKHPSTKEELIALARTSTAPITVCPPGLAPGSYDTEAERINRATVGSVRITRIRGED